MEAWYKPGKKEDKWRRCIVRDEQKPLRKEGLKTVFSESVTKHYKKLRDPLRVDGLWAWADVAQAFHAANLPLHTGTVSVERLWAHLKSYMPPSARSMSKSWFDFLSMLSCFAFNSQNVQCLLVSASHSPLRRWQLLADRTKVAT